MIILSILIIIIKNEFQITDMVHRIDKLTEYVEEQLAKTGLNERVNVIYLSDHGMSTVTEPYFIDLAKYVGNDTCKFYGTSPTLQVVPNDRGKLFMTNLLYVNYVLTNIFCLSFALLFRER